MKTVRKIILLFFISSIACLQLNAQSIEEGNRQLYMERYNTAKTIFENAIVTNPSNAEAWFGLVKSFILSDSTGKGGQLLSSAPESVHDEPFFLVAAGWISLRQQLDPAQYFQRALDKTKSKDPAILSAIAEGILLSKQGDVNYAIELLQKAIKKNKHYVNAYVLLGDAWRKLSNGSEAYKAYNAALEIDSRYAPAYNRLGELFLGQESGEMYLSNFHKAIAADSNYAPTLYHLYIYEMKRDPAKALVYYNRYKKKGDTSLSATYDLADLYYLVKNYDTAITLAHSILSKDPNAEPRIFKLLGYRYAGLNDTVAALKNMNEYFARQAGDKLIAKDYLFMAELNSSSKGNPDSAISYLERALPVETDSAARLGLLKKMIALAGKENNFMLQAKLAEQYVAANARATNVDIFNWGLALYRTEQYLKADSVFGIYTEKYPEQGFGYFWQARSLAMIDSNMKEGLAIPAYQKLIDILEKDSTASNYKKWITEAYGYLAAYEVNVEKDYDEAITHFERILVIDPENERARQYLDVLKEREEKEGQPEK